MEQEESSAKASSTSRTKGDTGKSPAAKSTTSPMKRPAACKVKKDSNKDKPEETKSPKKKDSKDKPGGKKTPNRKDSKNKDSEVDDEGDTEDKEMDKEAKKKNAHRLYMQFWRNIHQCWALI